MTKPRKSDVLGLLAVLAQVWSWVRFGWWCLKVFLRAHSCRWLGHVPVERSSVTTILTIDPVTCKAGQRIECYNVWNECRWCGLGLESIRGENE